MNKYKGKEVFIGIDVHKKTYSVTSISNKEIIKRDRMPAKPENLISYMKKYFKGAKLFSAYEAGFSGFNLHRSLEREGINNIVVHPASIEIASRERAKTDKRDSKKIAMQLSTERLKGVSIPNELRESFRLITRLRGQLVKEKNRKATQIKSFLHFIGTMPYIEDLKTSDKWLKTIIELPFNNEQKFYLEMLIEQWRDLNNKIKKIDMKLEEQSMVDIELEKIYRSAPGIGPTIARILINELGDMSQFSNERKLYSYTGLTPREHSSGEHRRLGHITRQGKSMLRKFLVQAAWKAIEVDPSLKEFFETIGYRAGKKRAIVATARKLIGIIRSCIKRKSLYKIIHGPELNACKSSK